MTKNFNNYPACNYCQTIYKSYQLAYKNLGMHAYTTRLTRRVLRTLPVLALTACSSFVQQPAPVERPAGTMNSVQSVTRSEPGTSPESASVAKATPYRQGSALKPAGAASGATSHVVQPGENLFRISLNHGLKYQDVAKWNDLQDYNIKAGQTLRLTPPSGTGTPAVAATTGTVAAAVSAPAQKAVKTYPKALKLPYSDDAVKHIASQSEGKGKTAVATTSPQSDSSAPVIQKHESSTPRQADNASDSKAVAGEDTVNWLWPTNGKTLKGYSDSNKGLDIGGRSGQPVLAAGDGKVVYSGNGLRGYGKLIIIKHNKTFLSAYAHNSQLLVKEGQAVKRGQKIAEMGNTDADQVKLHFEIRRFGKPVDPMHYLDSKS